MNDTPKSIITILIESISMSAEDCTLRSEDKCTAANLEPCDFKGDNFKECLKYRLYFIRPQAMQFR